jgi:hypothetical protein
VRCRRVQKGIIFQKYKINDYFSIQRFFFVMKVVTNGGGYICGERKQKRRHMEEKKKEKCTKISFFINIE